ncbi:TonB-dependent receptor domain-containing protein [Kozakia baliensis]|uniref:TonB-dependent receptor domain-containing protein n=1 Tax=Kozakia baliensis TaxID=153496 RepID=UPI0009F659EB|nr:TonB-dependent receptor [Kozakia baliensis]GBR32378.1 TonB-dependent receptor protein [Kozakia baliensis NRIC 0488]GEL64507.1 TonB-dependent receptor [Kozakia baliensis]
MNTSRKKLALLSFSAISGTFAFSPTAWAQTVTSGNAATINQAAATSNSASNTSGGANGGSENIVVTGSFLRTSNNTNANPVQVITAKQIQQTSASTLGDYLQRLPSIGNSGASNTQTNGFLGASCSDLRNLGSNRVLVLIDGKRAAQDPGASCIDMNTIPVQQIASVEILKDGGSELYGADAVSGVINIKLKHDVDTATITMRGGITDQGDGRTGQLSALKGFNFDHGKGNVTLFGQYMTSGPVMQRDRAWAANPQISNDPGEAPLYGSGYTAATRVMSGPGAGQIANSDGNGFHKFGTADRYNYGRDSSLSNYVQASTLNGDAHYEINPHFNVYANVRYTHKTAAASLAASPVQGSIYPSTLSNPLEIPANAPYNPWNGETVAIQKRYTELGGRRMENSTDNLQITGGMNGVITGDWNYDASMSYGITQARYDTENMGNYRHILNEYGVQQLDPTDPTSAITYNPGVCNASAGCVLQDPFKPMSAQASQYAKFTQHDHAQYMLRDFNLRVNNDKVVDLPYKGGGPIGLAFGIEHRSEQMNYVPDPLAQSGDTTGNTQSYTGGGFNATEVYGEAKIPLLHDVFLAKDLTIDGQGRWSHYNTFGNTQNWKLGINWAPIRDIRFRATLGTSYRQPSVAELYSGQSLGYAAAADPCSQADATHYGARSGNVVARCMMEGINPATFQVGNQGQVPAISGGNANLQPETGRTYTVGTVITPRWVPGLSASVEYWHYTIKNEINTVSAQYVLDACYTGSAPAYCNSIGARTSTNQLNYVTTLEENLGGLRTSGLDFDLDYRIRVTPRDVLTVSNNFQQVISYLQQNEPGGKWYNYAGRLFYQGSSAIGGTNGIPRVTNYTSATWSHRNLSFTYMMRYTGGMVWNDGTNDLTPASAGQYKTPGIFTHDVTVNYRLHNWNFEAGVNNILDKKPPFVYDAATNTANAIYSENIIGRYVFAQVDVNF